MLTSPCAFLSPQHLLIRPTPSTTLRARNAAHRPLFCKLSRPNHVQSASNPSPKPPPPPQQHSQSSTRMFSNIAPTKDGSLRRQHPSQLACTALVAGTMIGAGVLALPTVTAPAGFLPSSAALLAVWLYMLTTGLLISELTINTACSLGRPNAISILSLGKLTLGNFGASLTAVSYTLSVLFAAIIGTSMYTLSSQRVQTINNVLVAAVIASFLSVLLGSAADLHLSNLLDRHWDMLTHGPLLPVLFVSCVYHNVVSTVTMRLEGDRSKIRNTILAGSLIPLFMFMAYDATMLASASALSHAPSNQLAVAAFSLLAIITSFIGFVEGLTELWADVRQTCFSSGLLSKARWADFVATIVPPSVFAGLWPDVFLNALDAAGTYGIAVLFGGLPAAMAWRNRREERTKEFERAVGGGDAILALVGIIPVVLIAHKIWENVHTAV
ncbi:Tyrosine-specific transport protein 1 [Gracilariopsis chorda]|uniref:Tyrosine-specific transport protein 1 n=1 Tax=Gracilariopsis chorda TaxID=448386 RepID=A0A2V3IL52_9FLOR|nr:Tyrosine-specific transport protein 1 [Gracilariopsis chorda]|eukprot:PXF42804.1 Tyrosine-specific transport protein 1 [Gracilariopsis chorda]